MTNKPFFKWMTVLFSTLSMLTLVSCGDDEESDTPKSDLPVHEVILSRETGYGNDWIYYSLREGKELQGINEDNRKDNLDWDLAFNRYNIRTNSGLSGNGQGGAVDANTQDITDLVIAPETGYAVDVMGSITENTDHFPPPTIKSPLNMVLARSMHFQGPPPTYTPNNHVYVVKCANGQYAKIIVEGFYNDEGEAGFISFSYSIQTDGSRNL